MTTFAHLGTSAGSGLVIPETPDLARMRRETGVRLRSAMAERGVDALILLGNNAVVYATGASWPLGDAGLSYVERPVAVVLAGDDWPHLFLPFREGASHGSGPARRSPARAGLSRIRRRRSRFRARAGRSDSGWVGGRGRRVHRRHVPRRKSLFPNGAPVDAAAIVSAAKSVKTPDELSCMRTAIRITDEAMVEVHKRLAPGIRQIDLSASFLRRAFELGATASMLEPIWQVMPPSKAEGVWTTHGDLALPLLSTERELAEGDVLWTDVSITYQGYCSDFGRTWIVGRDPSPRQQAQFDKWFTIMTAVLDVAKAGATAADLGRAAIKANGGTKPWLPHFYLGHGIGVNAAEMPMIGTDLGQEFDENFVLQSGMVLVLEPVVWEDGTGGYRSEEVLVITEEGWIRLTDYPYDPYGN